MRKILGKLWGMSSFLPSLFLFLFLFYGTNTLIGASIVLRIVDINGRTALKTVAVGQPFVVEMRLQGFDETKKAPTIPGLASLRVQQKQEQLSVVNGKVTNLYQYVCRIDTTGSYGLGPVTIDHNGKQVTSNILTFMVQEQAEPAQGGRQAGGGKQRQKKEQPVICRLKLAHDHAVVGQKIACTLRLYYSDAVTGIAGVRRPELPGFVLGDFARGQEGQESVDGVEYRYVDFVGDICAQESGKKMVPAFSVDYDVQLPSRGSFFDFFNQAKRERVYSNTAHLQVNALPPTDKKVHAIGEFKAFRVSLDTAHAKEGEGVTLTAEVVGHGNVDISSSAGGANGVGIARFELRGLSDAIKQYESKQYTVPASSSGLGSDQAEKTCFEFIVQGVRAGKQEVPEQEFTYFDVVKKKYITLRSKPVPFTITAAQDSAASEIGHGENSARENSVNRAHAQAFISGQMPLSTVAWYPTKQRGAMPWWLFVLVLLMPVGALLSVVMWRRLEKYQDHYLRFTYAKRAFDQARSELSLGKKNGDTKALYGIFVRLFACRTHVFESAVSREFIKNLLERRHYPSQEIGGFDLFLSELEACKYDQGSSQAHSATLFQIAEQYIVWLEKRV
jgi:hypothetical protein